MEEKTKNIKFENFNPELMIIKLQEIINYIRKLKHEEKLANPSCN